MVSQSKIVFMGTPDFACTILRGLFEAGHDILAVFAQPDQPAGRGKKLVSPPVAVFSKKKGFKLFQPKKICDPVVTQTLRDWEPDFLVVAAYGKILPVDILKTPKKYAINVHASLLPKYRGAAPIPYALLQGEKETGVSIMQIAKDLDAGPVFLAKKIVIENSDNTVTLTQKLAELGAQALLEAIEQIMTGDLIPIEQNHAQATYAKKLTKDLASIDWTKTAEKIFNQVCALNPWPVAETVFQDQRVRIFEAGMGAPLQKGLPGEILHINPQGFTVATGQGSLLVKEVQVPGKKRGPAFDIANGLRLKVGDVLGEGVKGRKAF